MICSTKSRAKIFMWLSNSCITACFQFSWYFDYNPTRQLILFYSSPHRLFTFSSCSRIQARLKACSWQTIWLVSYDYEFITVWIYLFSWPKGQKVSLTFFSFWYCSEFILSPYTLHSLHLLLYWVQLLPIHFTFPHICVAWLKSWCSPDKWLSFTLHCS